jgi:hypothetical protein
VKSLPRFLISIALGLGAVVGAIVILTRSLASQEPLYRGQPADFWADHLNPRGPGSSNEAAGVLRDLILPQLTRRILSDTNDSPSTLWLVEHLDQLPGIRVDFTGADARRVQAVQDLARFGPAAQTAIPTLLGVLASKDELLIGPTADALVKMQTDPGVAVPALIPCLVTDDGRGRTDVVEALAEYGSKARAAVPILVKLLTDRSSKEIIIAVPRALKQIDPEAAARAGVK